MSLVFIDTETTGLDPTRHEIWEIAYAVDDGPVEHAIVPHSLRNADPFALKMNGYWDRVVAGQKYGSELEHRLQIELEGATIVGANPAFDAGFLRARWGVTPWHHRLWDVEAYAAGVLGLDKLLGNTGVAEELRGMGHDIPKPDHTAAADVAATRASFRALQSIAGVR